jgi:hypothetical protein
MKPKAEMFRPHMYTMWDAAHKHSENVCGAYIEINSNLDQTFDLTFEVSIQLDDLLPLSGMSILPTCFIDDIEVEIKNRIQGNFVYCQVDPNVLVDEYFNTVFANDGTWTVGGQHGSMYNFYASVHQEIDSSRYHKEFTQVGDTSLVCVHDYSAKKFCEIFLHQIFLLQIFGEKFFASKLLLLILDIFCNNS